LHLVLSLNREQQEPKVGTTPVLQMCKIRHAMTEGSPLFCFKTIINFSLFPTFLLKRSKWCVSNIFPSSIWNETFWWFKNIGKSWVMETPFSRFVKRAGKPSLNRMWCHFLLDDAYMKISGVFFPAPCHNFSWSWKSFSWAIRIFMKN